MQRITIIPADRFVAIDGRGIHGIDTSSIDPQIHAVQWYGQRGTIELMPDENGRPANIEITSLEWCQEVLDRWQDAVATIDSPPPLQVVDVQTRKLAEFVCACDAQLAAITRQYPESEIKSWDRQEQEARAYLADNTVSVPFIAAIARERGVTVRDLAQRIVAKADAYAVAAAAAIGHRQALEDQVSAIAADPTITDDEKRAAIAAAAW